MNYYCFEACIFSLRLCPDKKDPIFLGLSTYKVRVIAEIGPDFVIINQFL